MILKVFACLILTLEEKILECLILMNSTLFSGENIHTNVQAAQS